MAIDTYEYDENGRIKRVITTREPEWSPTDLAVIDLYDEWRDQYSQCGHLKTSLYHKEKNHNPQRYTAAFDRCLECEAIERVQHVQAKTDEKLMKNDKDKFIATRSRLWYSVERG